MATIEYDLDLSGGLMEEIQKIVEPPVSDEPRRKRGKERTEYKRPPRVLPNHTTCDSCGEVGDLLCCDRCPTALHLMCHEPPLDEDTVPTGEWLCRRCVTNPIPLPSAEVDDDAVSTCSSQSSSQGSTGSRRRGKPPLPEKPEKPVFIETFPEVPVQDEEGKPLHPLQMLARAAAQCNPRQFELQKSSECHIPFPGTSKRRWQHRDNRNSKKPSHEMDNGLVPLPAKTCFICTKSCLRAPLVPCDYCPLLFHMDCLDPPLTTLPSGRWMCPNHVENFLDGERLSSIRVSERMKLWDQFSGPVNQQAIKVKFIQKARRKNPPFKTKVFHPRKSKVKVPPSVKAQYLYPSALLPPLREAQVMAVQAGETPPTYYRATAEEQNEWLASVVGLQTSIARHIEKKSLTLSSDLTDSSSLNVPVIKSTATNPQINETSTPMEVDPTNSISDPLAVNGIDSSPESKDLSSIDVKKSGNVHSVTVNGDLKRHSSKTITCNKSDTASNTPSNQKTQLPNASNASMSPCSPPKSGSATCAIGSTNTLRSLSSTLKTILMSDAGIESTGTESLKLDENLLHILAYQRLQELLSAPGNESSNMSPNQPAIASTKMSSASLGKPSPELRPRALLCPMSGKGPQVPMYYRSLYIGTGANMELCLSQFGHCNFISTKHACIFYDEMTRHYELINYSEHGTTVDNVLYSCDFSDLNKIKSPVPPANSVASLRKIIGRAKKARAEEAAAQRDKEREKMTKMAYTTRQPCSCRTSGSSLIGGGAGWEGAAVLHHGSYIKLGCMQFVFSIVEQANIDPESQKSAAEETTSPANSSKSSLPVAGTSLLKATLKSPATVSSSS